jgi:glycosyltransferase involved in cell wall biosynthesis
MASPVPKIAVAMIGARRQYAVPRILAGRGWLETFFTDYFLRASLWANIARKRIWPKFIRALAGRHTPEIPPNRVRDFPLFALRRMRAAKRARAESHRWRAFADWNREFAARVSQQDWGAANGVYAFNAAGLEILQRATREHLIRLIDQTTLPWEVEQRLLQEERTRWPDWEEGSVSESDWAALAERERAEWRLADLILCGSEPVREALIRCGVSAEQCEVVPYGVAPEHASPKTKAPRSGPLRVLFVGTLELRKGIPYLWQAAQRLPESVAIFRAVGSIRLSAAATAQLTPRIALLGPLPRAALANEYDWADVLVLPTLSEGSANVCYEAIARGVPVITTPAAGSVIRDGEEGFIVPPRDADALAERLATLAEDRARLRALAEASFRRAQEFTLERYAARLTAAIGALYERHLAQALS